jgi:hypothetical protein
MRRQIRILPSRLATVGMATYLLAVIAGLVLDGDVCRESFVLASLAGMLSIAIGGLIGLMVSMVDRATLAFLRAAAWVLISLLLCYFFYLLLTRCPGW